MESPVFHRPLTLIFLSSMRVLILGGGTVGASVAETLCGQKHVVTIIEKNPVLAKALDERLEATVYPGLASQSAILFQLQPASMDLVLALTGDDEVNLVAASMAKAMGARRTAARVYADVYHDQSTFDYRHHFNIDRLMSVEQLTAMELVRYIREPGEVLIENFARGNLEMQDLLIMRSSSWTDKPLKDVNMPPQVRVAVINRGGELSIATANDQVRAGDRISLLGSREDVEKVKAMFDIQIRQKRNIVVGGCGETGFHLATILQHRGYHVSVIENNRARCEEISRLLNQTTVICSDARKQACLEEERVGSADAFIACMGADEENILSCIEASAIGTKTTLAVVNKPDYANIIERLGITHAVSSRAVMAKQVQQLMNTGPVISRNSRLFGRGIDVLELEVFENTPITRDTLRDVNLPVKSLIGAAIRDNSIQVPTADYRFRPGDIVIAIAQSESVNELVRAFQNDN